MIIWVDNTAGNDAHIGDNPLFPVATVEQGVDNINEYGSPGDTLRICYTGQDYSFTSSPSSFTGRGTGWGDGEFYTVEGYDREGGYNRPKLWLPATGNTGYRLYFNTLANYWLSKDLWFKFEQNTSYTCYAFYFSSGLTDDEHYFKIRSCRFDGQYGSAGTDNHSALYASNGARCLIDIQYCFFNNTRFHVRAGTTSPLYLGWIFKNNIIYSPYRQSTGNFTCDPGDLAKDITISNNTCYSTNSSQYNGYLFSMSTGDVTSSDYVNFECKNNFCFYFNYMLRGTSTSPNGDLIPNVGYNTWGKLNSSYAGYVGAGFDIFETEADYGAYGDYPIHSTHDKNDYTSIFKAHADITYRWPDTGWMLVPDVRPIGWEMTGSFEDPINGLRGAIQYSGLYKDTTFYTGHLCEISPLYKSNNYLGSYGFGGSSEAYKLMDTNIEQGFNLSFSTDHTMSFSDFCSFGGIGGGDYTILDIATKPASRVYTSTVTADTFEGGATEGNSIYARTQLRYSGTGDYTSPWSNFIKGSRTNQFTNPAIAGSYNVYFRYWVAQDDNTSAWEQIDSFMI